MKEKRTYIIILILLLVITILAGITYNSIKIVTEKVVENHQQSIVSEAAKTVELWLSQHLRIIQATADAVQQIQIGSNSQTLRLLKTAMKAGNFSDVYIGLKDGTMIDGADWPPPAGYDPRIRPWYKKAVKDKQISFTTPYVDMTTNKMVIAIVMPLIINNEFVGVISSDIVLDTLKQNVMNVKIGQSGYTFIVDSHGTVLVHPDESLLMTNKIQESDKTLDKILAYFNTSVSGSYHYQFHGEQKILSFHKLVNSDWILCTTVLKEEAYTLAKNTAMLFAMGVVFKILGILMVLLFLTVGGSFLIYIISKQRFEETVQNHKKILSGKDKDLKGEIIRRKEIETRYQTLFNVATNAIMLSKNFQFIECNEKAMAMFGLTHDDVTGKSMLDLSSDIQQDGRKSHEKFDEIIQNLAAGEQKIFEWAFKRSDGSEFPAEVELKTLHLDSEMVTLYSIWDISKRINAEQELRQVQKMAAMGEMLSAIAHQWRQPLNALSTYIASLPPAFYNNLISRDFIEKLVKEADSQIQFMSRTINDFRQYFRPSKTKQVFEVHVAIDNAVKIIRPQLRQNAINLILDENEPPKNYFVYGYKNEFVHVLVNIIANAKDAIIEAAKEKPEQDNRRLIELSTKAIQENLELQIMDSGCGIPESLMPKIFTPYFTTKGTATGTGIGLYMAKQIVEKEMSGEITAENIAAGTRFTIKLPLSELKG